MCTTHQNEEQSNTQDCCFKFNYSPRKRRWLQTGESETLTFNQMIRLTNIIEELEHELNEPYTSQVKAELEDIIARLYALMEENTYG